MFRILAAAAAASLLVAVPASAQMRTGMTLSGPAKPDTGYERIRMGRLQQAETTLLAARDSHPGAQEVALNLAAVYVMTGRANLAKPLYEQVLAAKPVAMDMPSGTVASSHDVARTGISRTAAATETAQYAAR
jgi:Flp pilus assembly protein TadD